MPGVLGMNILQRCYRTLFGQHGFTLFDLPLVTEAPASVVQALQRCHKVSEAPQSGVASRVKVRGQKVCRIPGGTMQVVPATCSARYSGATVLFEPSDQGLPASLLASPALVHVENGTAHIPIVNVGSSDVVLYPRTVVGVLSEVSVVSLPPGVEEVPSHTASVASHVTGPLLPDQVEAVDLSVLSDEEQREARSLFRKYTSVFSSHDGDLGCTKLISHEIPLMDETPRRDAIGASLLPNTKSSRNTLTSCLVPR